MDSEDEAEIGYYISGQEPYIKLYKDENGNTMSFSSLEDGLSKLSEKQRKEFATNKKTDENGNVSSTGKNIESFCGDSVEEYPLAYSEYQEQYFVSSEDGWKRVDFVDADGNPRTDTVKIKGHYQENTAGNGQYTKEEQTYYPIRKNVTEDNAKTNKYRENIENFYYSDDEEAQAPFFTYTAPDGTEHIVWFENEQSWTARLALVEEYGLAGVSIWNIMNIFYGGI